MLLKEIRRRDRQRAQKYDYFYAERKGRLFCSNKSFYSDGSLKKDCYTGKVYKKGVYFVNSKGINARGEVDHRKIKPF